MRKKKNINKCVRRIILRNERKQEICMKTVEARAIVDLYPKNSSNVHQRFLKFLIRDLHKKKNFSAA